MLQPDAQALVQMELASLPLVQLVLQQQPSWRLVF